MTSLNTDNNHNDLLQLHTVNGSGDLIPKKEYLIKLKAQSRYHDLLKKARKANLDIHQYTIKEYSCSVEDHCGDSYKHRELWSSISPGLDSADRKRFDKEKNRIKSLLPPYISWTQFQSQVQGLLRSYIVNNRSVHYAKSTLNHRDTPYIMCSNSYKQELAKGLVSKRVGVENICTDLYVNLYTDSPVDSENIVLINLTQFIIELLLTKYEAISEEIKEGKEVTFKLLSHRECLDIHSLKCFIKESCGQEGIVIYSATKDKFNSSTDFVLTGADNNTVLINKL